MRKLLSLNLLVALAVIIASCGTNNNVVNNRLISKRKYNKGFHINRKGNMKSSKVDKEEESVAFEDVKSKPSKEKKSRTERSTTSKEVVENETVAFVENNGAEVSERPTSYVDVERNAAPQDTDGSNVDFEMEEDVASNQQKSNRTHHKARKTNFKSTKNDNAASADVTTILLVILALIIAPLAVALYEGITNRFWITLILWLIGVGVGFWLLGGGIAWLCGLIAAIYAILIVLGVI